jgi:hypothetical protein
MKKILKKDVQSEKILKGKKSFFLFKILPAKFNTSLY